MRGTSTGGNVTHTNAVMAMIDGLRYVRGEVIIGTLLVMESIISIFGAYSQMMVIFAKDIFLMGPEGLGILQSAVGAGSLVGSLALAAIGDIRHKGRLLVASGLVHAASIALFSFCPVFLLALPILFATGASDILFGATRTTIIQMRVREDMRGRVMALSSISMRGVGPLGAFQTGTLATFVGVQTAIALGAAVVVGMLVGAVLRVRELQSFDDMDPESRPPISGSTAEPLPAHN